MRRESGNGIKPVFFVDRFCLAQNTCLGLGVAQSNHTIRGTLDVNDQLALHAGTIIFGGRVVDRSHELVFRGKWYLSNFDKPHDLSLVLNYQYNQRHTVTLNFTYGTGRPTTAPQGGYRTQLGVPVPIYSERNALRIPDYHRMDLAYTIGKDHRKNNKFKTSWTISLYNVYARKNAFSVYFTQTPFTSAQANRLAILGSVFPSVTFNFETL